jgi:hypothetical protein
MEEQPHQIPQPEEPRGCTFLDYVENHPVAAITQALAVGFAVGLVIRLLDGSRDKEREINIARKPSLDDAKFHLGSLVLPFLWPAWQKAREGAQDGYKKSSDTLHDTLEKLKKSDLTAEGKKRLHEAEEWAEREAGHLAKLGKAKAKEIEKWVEDEILPAAETGWKKLRKYFS